MDSHTITIKNIEDLDLATGGHRDFRPTLLGSEPVSGLLKAAFFDGFSMTYGNFKSNIHVSGTYSNEKLSLAVVLPQTKDVSLFGKVAQPGDLVVVGRAQETDGCYRGQLEYITINIDKADALRIAESEDLIIPPGVLDGSDIFEPEKRTAARLTTRMGALTQTLQNESLPALELETERRLGDEIVTELLRPLSCAISKERTGQRQHWNLPKLVHRAEDFLEDYPGHGPTIQQLADGLHVSPRQLFRAFKAEIEMSPARYLKNFRLARVRLALLAAEPEETTVTRMALYWGFLELGRFAVEYRQAFGERPSQTLRRSRKSGAIDEARIPMARMG